MAACVTDVRQSIIFCVEVHPATTRATARLKGGLESIGMTSDSETLSFKEIADCIMCFVLFEADFGVAPYLDSCQTASRFGHVVNPMYFVIDLPEVLVQLRDQGVHSFPDLLGNGYFGNHLEEIS
jgi:hypothetical protein